MHWCCWYNSWGALHRLLWTLVQLLLQEGPAVKELWSHQEAPGQDHPSLNKALAFKEKNQQSVLAQHKRKYHTADTTGWSDLRHQGHGSSSWTYSTSKRMVLLGGPAEGRGSKKGLPWRVGAVLGKKAKVPFEKQQTDSTAEWTIHKCRKESAKFTFEAFPCQFHWFLPNSPILFSLCQ